STNDVAELSKAATETVPIFTNSGFAIVTTALALVTLDWQVLLAIVVPSPIYIISVRRSLRVAPGRYAAGRACVGGPGWRVVRAFGMEESMHNRSHAASWDVVEHGYSARRTMFVLQLWMTSVEFVMLTAGLIVGFITVQSGAMTVGAVTGAMLMLIRLRGPLM